MNTSATMDDTYTNSLENIGIQFASLRQQHGYSLEYVATKLHLRVRIIELIESGQFNLLPEPVFIKGYLRAYSKLLGVSPDPFINTFNSLCATEKKPDRAALWQQSKPESHKVEHMIRWFTILFALGVLISVGVWWEKNRDVKQDIVAKESETSISLNHNTELQNTAEISSTDISAMQNLLLPKSDMSLMEEEGA